MKEYQVNKIYFRKEKKCSKGKCRYYKKPSICGITGAKIKYMAKDARKVKDYICPFEWERKEIKYDIKYRGKPKIAKKFYWVVSMTEENKQTAQDLLDQMLGKNGNIDVKVPDFPDGKNADEEAEISGFYRPARKRK